MKLLNFGGGGLNPGEPKTYARKNDWKMYPKVDVTRFDNLEDRQQAEIRLEILNRSNAFELHYC